MVFSQVRIDNSAAVGLLVLALYPHNIAAAVVYMPFADIYVLYPVDRLSARNMARKPCVASFFRYPYPVPSSMPLQCVPSTGYHSRLFSDPVIWFHDNIRLHVQRYLEKTPKLRRELCEAWPFEFRLLFQSRQHLYLCSVHNPK